MGFSCMADNRSLKELDFTVHGSLVFDETYLTDEDSSSHPHQPVDRSYYFQKSKQFYIEEEDFIKYSKTGDILLYETSHFGAKMIRTATGSKYDHVAMIVKSWYPNCPSEKVFIFECVQDVGVRITDWNSIKDEVGRDKFYRKLVYRSVDFNRKKNVQKLIEFAKSKLGKKYGMNILNRSQDDDDAQQEYFCSELIADAFKKAGIMKQKGIKKLYTFTPNCFSQNGQKNLELINNIKIHREREILINSGYNHVSPMIMDSPKGKK